MQGVWPVGEEAELREGKAYGEEGPVFGMGPHGEQV